MGKFACLGFLFKSITKSSPKPVWGKSSSFRRLDRTVSEVSFPSELGPR